jgi:hypothetical protein
MIRAQQVTESVQKKETLSMVVVDVFVSKVPGSSSMGDEIVNSSSEASGKYGVWKVRSQWRLWSFPKHDMIGSSLMAWRS